MNGAYSSEDDELTNPGYPLPRAKALEDAKVSRERIRVSDTVFAWIADGAPRARSVRFETEADGAMAVVVEDKTIGSVVRLRLSAASTEDPFQAAAVAMMRVGL